MKKLINIPFTGVILAKGGIYGPIDSNYMEDVNVILAMLVDGVKINEVVNGENVPLNLLNYDKVNIPEIELEPSIPVPPAEPEVPETVEVEKANVEGVKVEKPTANIVVDEPNMNNNPKNFKKRR